VEIFEQQSVADGCIDMPRAGLDPDIGFVRQDSTGVALMQGQAARQTRAFLRCNSPGAGFLDQADTAHQLDIGLQTAYAVE
jgi:hypothetical protein